MLGTAKLTLKYKVPKSRKNPYLEQYRKIRFNRLFMIL